MKRTKNENMLRKKFDDAQDTMQTGQKIREERRIIKKKMTKLSRKLGKEELVRSSNEENPWTE